MDADALGIDATDSIDVSASGASVDQRSQSPPGFVFTAQPSPPSSKEDADAGVAAADAECPDGPLKQVHQAMREKQDEQR